MPKSTIKSKAEIDAVFRTGSRASSRHCTVIVAETPPRRGPQGRVVFVAAKRLGGAVSRNRAKRVLRASFFRLGGPWAATDVVLIARGSTGTASPIELDQSIRSALQELGVFPRATSS